MGKSGKALFLSMLLLFPSHRSQSSIRVHQHHDRWIGRWRVMRINHRIKAKAPAMVARPIIEPPKKQIPALGGSFELTKIKVF